MARLTDRHIEYLNNYDFLQQYLLILNSRLVYSNNRVELNSSEIDNLYDSNNILSLDDNFKAFNILLKKLQIDNDKIITPDLIKEIANTINKHALYISNNYRTIDNDVKFAEKYSIEKPENIEEKIKELLNKYYNDWKNLDIFEREALFNIEFLRIHPFDDGNGRTSRLLLNYNILLNRQAPILIPINKRDDYFNARNREDVKWIKKLFEEESNNELKALDKLIESYELEKKSQKSIKK